MAIKEEDLVQDNYYVHSNHGVCLYKGIKYLTVRNIENIKCYCLIFLDGESLYVPNDQLDLITECDKQYGQNIGLTKLGNIRWKNKYNKILLDNEILTKTKKSLLQIKAYENILMNGVKNNKIVLEQYYKKYIGDDKAMNNFIESVLQKSTYPEGYNKDIEVEYEASSKTAIINYRIPNTVEVPNTIKYKYDSLIEGLIEIKMKDKEFNKYYESVVFQSTLRSIKEVFDSIGNDILDTIVFNGLAEDIDKKTGNNFTSCIISLMVPRSQFEKINLTQISYKDCILYLKGIFVGQLQQLSPVKPILDINRNDRRFISNKGILSELDEGVNLAEMDWEDFEYLVRELFEKIFSDDGSEVRVTQASRDGGVDAVAFDNDPIKGGKFIIQAKRYNNVVSVSASRDLYGTVINEGAVKGILVTTSYFGNDSREFAKDKPITLIDGSNLVYLLNKYGYKAHIKLKKK